MSLLKKEMNENESKFDFAVIGLGLTGQSAIRFLLKKGMRVIAMDTRVDPPQSKDDWEKNVPVLKGEIDHDCLGLCQKIIF